MLYFILIILFLIIIGIISNVLNIRRLSNDYNFIYEYREKFSKFISDLMNKDKYNNKDYEWLISNSDKIQIILGDSGKMLYRDNRGYYPNYEIVINFMNEVLTLKSNGLIEYEGDQITWCHNSFLRKMGIIDELQKKEIKRLLNPIYDLTSGIKVLLGIPLDILFSVGLLSFKSITKLKDSILFKLFSGLISILTFLSVVITIVIGWNQFIEIIKGIINIK